MTAYRESRRANNDKRAGVHALKAFVYRTTKSPVPGWQSVHEKQPRGVAYETDQHFVHIYGAADQLWTISNGLTVTDKKDGTLADWIIGQFGGENIEQSNLDVGSTIEGVWRPGLFYDVEMLQGLAETNVNLRLAEQALLLLIQRLDELLLFVEPTTQSLAAHSHKARELLILACTEVEAQWKHHALRGGLQPKNQGFKTNDYVLLSGPLNLGEYEIVLPRYEEVPPIRPFLGWSPTRPTQSIPWYDAYNKTKHDGKDQFAAATLLSCIQAVAANIVMFSVRFGPFRLYQGGGMLSAIFNPTFAIALRECDPKSFYVPEVDVAGRNQGLTWGQAENLSRKPIPFTLSSA
jgi:hypothetical protein